MEKVIKTAGDLIAAVHCLTLTFALLMGFLYWMGVNDPDEMRDLMCQSGILSVCSLVGFLMYLDLDTQDSALRSLYTDDL
jgi:hypothetical protein